MTSLKTSEEALATLTGFDSITLAGKTMDAKITGLCTDTTVVRSIAAVSTFEMVFSDSQRKVARSGIFGKDVTCHVGAYHYGCTGISKSGEELTVSFQDYIVTQLEAVTTPLKVAEGVMTHVQFVQSMLKQFKWLKFKTVSNPGKYKVIKSNNPLYRGDPTATDPADKIEGTWTAINRIGTDRGWRTFTRGTDELWYVPDPYLYAQAPDVTMSEDNDWVDDIDYDVDIRKKIATLSVIAYGAANVLAPGMVARIKDKGPTNGKWLVQDITREPITDPKMTITLIAPTPILPEPVADSSSGDETVGSDGEDGVGGTKISSDAATAVAQYAMNAGFTGANLLTAVEVSFAEDGSHDPTVFSAPNHDGSIDRGLWQINSKAHANYTDDEMKKGAANAIAAYAISSHGTNWHPWTTYNSGAYLRYAKQAEAAIAAAKKYNLNNGSEAATIGTGSGGVAPSRTTTKLAPDFVNEVLSQKGKPYEFGNESSPSNANPSGFDCSSLVAWGVERVGISTSFPRNAEAQYEYCVSHSTQISVARAIYIRGALLFKAGSDPQGHYGIGHVAISMGNGTDAYQAYATGYDIGTFHDAKTFSHAALVPGMRY